MLLLLTHSNDSQYLFSTLNFNGFVFIFVNKSKQPFEISRHLALMKNTKLTKVQILTRNLNIRGDLGQTFLALLAFTLREHQNHSGTCGTYGCSHRRGFRGSENLHLKPELRMVFEF